MKPQEFLSICPAEYVIFTVDESGHQTIWSALPDKNQREWFKDNNKPRKSKIHYEYVPLWLDVELNDKPWTEQIYYRKGYKGSRK